MKNRIGVSAFAWTSLFTEQHLQLLPMLREQGVRAFELPMFVPGHFPAPGRVRAAFAAQNMECTICAILPPGINPISPDSAVRNQSHQHLRECIETASAMGATLLGGPLYAPIGYLPDHRPTQEEWRWAVEAMQALGDLLESCNVTLSLEPVNRSETFFMRTAAEAAALCEAIAHPRIGVTIDTFHGNIEEKSIPAAIRMLGPRLKHLHLSENDRGVLGSGHVDFAAVLAAAKEIGYTGLLMIEGFGYSGDREPGPGRLWADPSVSPEAMAIEGASYLRGLLNQGY